MRELYIDKSKRRYDYSIHLDNYALFIRLNFLSENDYGSLRLKNNHEWSTIKCSEGSIVCFAQPYFLAFLCFIVT